MGRRKDGRRERDRVRAALVLTCQDRLSIKVSVHRASVFWPVGLNTTDHFHIVFLSPISNSNSKKTSQKCHHFPISTSATYLSIDQSTIITLSQPASPPHPMQWRRILLFKTQPQAEPQKGELFDYDLSFCHVPGIHACNTNFLFSFVCSSVRAYVP